jgi:hypothetical protein
MVWIGLDSTDMWKDPMMIYSEHTSEPLDAIKGKEFLGQAS